MPTRRAPQATPVPVVPGYVLEELLGRGGSGEVWRARPRAGGPPVAVKVLLRGDPDRQDREAALLAELDHPHLVRLVEVVHCELRDGGDQVALVLDLLAGGSLARLISRRGRLRPGEVVTAIAPVAAALAHAHDRGIVHGDLSPGNIVFTEEGRPVLTDLGVGRVVGQQARGEVTPAYVDPVVARGGAPGPASDVFGAAAAAFHALTGIAPWNAAGAAEILAVAAAGEVPDLAVLAPEAPDALIAVIGRGLSPHPHLRGSAAAFALDLRHACRPERIAMPHQGADDVGLARTDRASFTELTHQLRRPPGAHAVRPAAGRWAAAWRRLGRLVRPRVGVAVAARRAVGAAVVVVAVLAAGYLGAQWGRSGDAEAVPAARAGDLAAGATDPATTAAGPVGPTAPSGGGSAPSSGVGPAPPGPPVSTTDATAVSTAPGDESGWRALVAGLYDQRAEAFARLDSSLLGAVYTPDSPLLSADAAQLAAAVTDGTAWIGFAPVVEEVRSITGPREGALDAIELVQLELVDRVPPYVIEGAAGTRTELAGRGEVLVAMTLARTPTGWRIADAVRLP